MNLQPIWPPVPFSVLPAACTSCGKDVRTDTGFADLDGPPFKAYMCVACTTISIGGSRVAEAQAASQRRYFDLHGHWPIAR
jgi:hypothetical protein